MTKFRSIDCPAGVPDLVIDRAGENDTSGTAEILMRAPQFASLNGSWSLNGSTLQVTGDGVNISGQWSGSRFTAHAVVSGAEADCSYRVSGTSG